MSLEVLTWAEISEISKEGNASAYWAVGDTKSVALNGTVGMTEFDNDTYYAFILGFDHNADLEGENTIHWQFAKTDDGIDVAFVDSEYDIQGSTPAFRMNLEAKIEGGWEASYMRNTLCPQFLECLPSSLQRVIREVTKYTDNGNGLGAASDVSPTQDKIFIIGQYEVYTENLINTAEANYQERYAYYIAGNSKIKYSHLDTTKAVYSFTRSPRAMEGSQAFRTTGTAEESSYRYANRSQGFSPCFVV